MTKFNTAKYSFLTFIFYLFNLVFEALLLFCAAFYFFSLFGKEEILAECFQQLNLHDFYYRTTKILNNSNSIEFNKAYTFFAVATILLSIINAIQITKKTIAYSNRAIEEGQDFDPIKELENVIKPNFSLKFLRIILLLLLSAFVIFQLLYPTYSIWDIIKAKEFPHKPDWNKLIDVRLLSFFLTIFPFGVMLWKTHYDNPRELTAYETHRLLDDLSTSSQDISIQYSSYQQKAMEDLKAKKKLLASLNAATLCCFFGNLCVMILVENSIIALVLNTIITAINAAVNNKISTFPLEESRNMYKKNVAYWHGKTPGHKADWSCAQDYERYKDYLE